MPRQAAPARPPFDPAECFQDRPPEPVLRTGLGALFQDDCLALLPRLAPETFDTVFADPPFNLNKAYGPHMEDLQPDEAYLAWCRLWLDECVRVLRPGGALLVFNLPKWNVPLGAHLQERGLTFRHWITVDLRFGMPIPKRLYPSHYSLLYYTRGEARTFRRIRVPIATCRHCGKELKDYGGHRRSMNPNGVTLSDVWTDVPPVRHWKFKSKKRRANQLSTRILDRVVEMTTREGDLVLDPFGGSGTTFDACERKGRRSIGIEMGPVDLIAERLEQGDVHAHANHDWVEV